MSKKLLESSILKLKPDPPNTKQCGICGLFRKLSRFPLDCHTFCQYCLILINPSISDSNPRYWVCANKKCDSKAKLTENIKKKKKKPNLLNQNNNENTQISELNSQIRNININTNSTKPYLLETSKPQNPTQINEIKMIEKENPANLAQSERKTISCHCSLI